MYISQQLDLDGQPVHSGGKYEIDPINSYEQNYLSDYRQYVVLLKGDIAPRFLECYDHMVLKQAKKIKWHLVSEIIRVDS